MEIPSKELVAAVKQAMGEFKPKKLSKNKLHQQIQDGDFPNRLNKAYVRLFLDGDKLVPTYTSETMRLWLSQQSHVPVPVTDTEHCHDPMETDNTTSAPKTPSKLLAWKLRSHTFKLGMIHVMREVALREEASSYHTTSASTI